ncbi:endonuclease/exonuclease/phosphatase family protein [Prosthecomicrobium sp. N25]|uniref:endonuclease/exonuclease/phosphatase family protein n=1 Tax=Prosthecomicrobium sp. N25 TaxID=3129254 RepID=UPI0030769F26
MTPVRIATWNVHSCIGTDGVLSPRRIAEVIAETGAEVVALQELDVGRRRTGRIDQAEAIALELGMEVAFHPALRVVEEAYGDAILSTRALRLVKADALPGWSFGARFRAEPRGALWVEVDVDGAKLQMINTHLGLVPAEQRAQVAALLGPDWLGHPHCREPTLLVGDFNAPPLGRTYRTLAARFADVQTVPGAGRARATFPSRLPLLRIDHAFTCGPVAVAKAEVFSSPLARLASDHLPLVIDLGLVPAPGKRSAGSRLDPVPEAALEAGSRL